jgi:hypothetical protein
LAPIPVLRRNPAAFVKPPLRQCVRDYRLDPLQGRPQLRPLLLGALHRGEDAGQAVDLCGGAARWLSSDTYFPS